MNDHNKNIADILRDTADDIENNEENVTYFNIRDGTTPNGETEQAVEVRYKE
ncbi:hypothetical protein [Natrinema sp. DC36]|uniref:hypothetical protein n=1 Tax=Natrinema sp. DC36 TaxID=2878680 RepID=UPI001CF0C6CC|nr:hypothetical protein [Natrinema sp. DC36]